MRDYHPQVVAALNTVLPTHYEMTLHSGIAVPCISYMELGNTQITQATGTETQAVSRITFQVKVWANEIATIQEYAPQVDVAMRALGFKRASSAELYDRNSTMIQKVLTYEGLSLEIYE